MVGKWRGAWPWPGRIAGTHAPRGATIDFFFRCYVGF
jgi:hypothetical protein